MEMQHSDKRKVNERLNKSDQLLNFMFFVLCFIFIVLMSQMARAIFYTHQILARVLACARAIVCIKWGRPPRSVIFNDAPVNRIPFLRG